MQKIEKEVVLNKVKDIKKEKKKTILLIVMTIILLITILALIGTILNYYTKDKLDQNVPKELLILNIKRED